MEKGRTDRRVSRTRRQLREALLSLILEKGYDAVTVEEITERADLGRTTFYLHYRDKEELLLECIQSISEELKGQVFQTAIEQVDRLDAQIPIYEVFQHAADNASLYQVILNGAAGRSAGTHMREIISQAAWEFLTQRLPEMHRTVRSRVPLDVFCHYFAGALIGFLTWWLEASQPYSPREMAELFRQLYFDGGRVVIEIVNEEAV